MLYQFKKYPVRSFLIASKDPSFLNTYGPNFFFDEEKFIYMRTFHQGYFCGFEVYNVNELKKNSTRFPVNQADENCIIPIKEYENCIVSINADLSRLIILKMNGYFLYKSPSKLHFNAKAVPQFVTFSCLELANSYNQVEFIKWISSDEIIFSFSN